jgi:FAD synthetase
MAKIIDSHKAIEISKKLKNHKKIVLCGGCFDILHKGHIEFLEEAKKRGDTLFVLLESDESVRKLKGKDRPVNKQEKRALVLSSVESIDYVVPISLLKHDKDYDDLIIKINPDIIATTQNDPGKHHKIRQAKLINARVLDVIKKIKGESTTELTKLIL